MGQPTHRPMGSRRAAPAAVGGTTTYKKTVIKEKREMAAYKLLLILQNTACQIELHLKNWKRSTNYSKRWTRWSNEAEEGQGGGETPGRSPSLDAQGADTLNTRVSGCSSLRPLQGGGNMGQGTCPL